MTWLITGGAGYIGSHVVETALARHFKIVVADNLVTGREKRLPADTPFLNASVSDDEILDFIQQHGVTGIVHLAALKNVGESALDPDKYWQTNVAQLERLLEMSKSAQVKHFVFSSSAAVYGQPDVQVITEDTPANPINTYGKTKLEGEFLLDKFPEMSIISLRYFNVAGAGSQTLADTELQNLIPISIDKIEKDLAVHIYGDTFPTPDGTCVRDYIHVLDIAEAHVHAMELVRSEYVSNERINLGTGLGKSVKQVLSEIELVSGLPLKQIIDAPRAGDPAKLVASSKYAKLRLGWTARRTFSEIIRDSWQYRA